MHSPDRLSSESSSSSSSSSRSSSSSSSSSSTESSDSLLAGRPAVGLHVPGMPTPGIPTPGILTPGIPTPDSPTRNRLTGGCTKWFWAKPFQEANGSACPSPAPVCPLLFGVLFFLDPWPVAGGEVVGGCDGAPAWVDAWVLLAPVLKLTGIDPASESHWGDLPCGAESLRGLVMRAKGASWVVLWMTPLGWWGSGSPRRALERKRLEWLFWGGVGWAGGNGDEDNDVLLGDLFGPCCCFFSSAGNVCPWDMRICKSKEEEERKRVGVAGSKRRGGRKKENRRHKEKLEKKGDKVQLLQLSVWISVDCLSRWQNYNAEKWYSQLCLSLFLRSRRSINAITRGFVWGKFTTRDTADQTANAITLSADLKSPITITMTQLVGLCFTLIASLVQAVLSRGRRDLS